MRHLRMTRHIALGALATLALAVPVAAAHPAPTKRPHAPTRPDGKRIRVHDRSKLATAAGDYTVDVLCIASGAGVDTGGNVEFSVSDTERFGFAAWGETVYVRSYVKDVNRRTGSSTWFDYGSWSSYTVKDNTSGQWTDFLHPVIGGTSVGSAVRQQWTVPPGHDAYMALYVYTKRAGMYFIPLAPTQISAGLPASTRGECRF